MCNNPKHAEKTGERRRRKNFEVKLTRQSSSSSRAKPFTSAAHLGLGRKPLARPRVQKHVALPPTRGGGKAALRFHWTLCGISFLRPHQKTANNMRRRSISLLLLLHLSPHNTAVFSTSSLTLCVRVYGEAAPLNRIRASMGNGSERARPSPPSAPIFSRSVNQ